MIWVVYRAYGGENLKDRPPYFSKMRSMASFVRAAARVQVNVLVLADGPLPREWYPLLTDLGEIVQIADSPIGMRGSYRKALDLPQERGWDDDDFVYYSEDDYLYHPDAFIALEAAVEQIPEAGYLALYGSTPARHNSYEFPDGVVHPPGWPTLPVRRVLDQDWVNIPSTASTFGGRVAAINQDKPIFRQAMYPFRHRYWDHATAVAYQGQTPFPGMQAWLGQPGEYPATAYGYARQFGLSPFRIGMNWRALTRRHDPHWLYVADPNYAVHCELQVINPGRDWAAIATDTGEWAAGRGIALPPLRAEAT